MTWQVNSWIDALAAFVMDQGWGDSFGLVDVGRSTDEVDLPSSTIVLSEVPGVLDANFGWGGDVQGAYCNLLVRGEPNDYQPPRDAVWGVLRQLERLGAATVHGYQFVMVGGGSPPSPSALGKDSADRYRWTVDVPVWFMAPDVPQPIVIHP